MSFESKPTGLLKDKKKDKKDTEKVLTCFLMNHQQKGNRAAKLNEFTTRMLKYAHWQVYNVNLAAIRLGTHLKGQLHAWYHLHDGRTGLLICQLMSYLWVVLF
jgi:hypothetical protein